MSPSILYVFALVLCLFVTAKCFVQPFQSRCAGTSIKKQTKINSYPIHNAAEDGKLDEVMKLVLEDKNNLKLVETEGNIALHFAAKWGYFDMVQFLVDQGAEINYKNDRGRTSLHLSVSWEHTEISKYLVSKGADLKAKNKDGQTPLMYAKKIGIDKELLEISKSVEVQPHTRSRGDW